MPHAGCDILLLVVSCVGVDKFDAEPYMFLSMLPRLVGAVNAWCMNECPPVGGVPSSGSASATMPELP